MSKVIVRKSFLKGEVNIPPSKSCVHRAIICASLAKGKSVISPVDFSNDIKATISCIKELGAKVIINNNSITVDGIDVFSNKEVELNCCESGSTLRFLIPVVGVGGIKATFLGEGRLPQRPIGTYLDLLPKHGINLNTQGGLPLESSGTLKAGEYKVKGNISSQFITGLMFALPVLSEDSKIILTSELESKGYVDMTIDVMKSYGVEILEEEYGYYIKGRQSYKACDYTTEGDWSQVAFFMGAGAINGDITIKGVNINTSQGDKECVEIFKRFNAEVLVEENLVKVKKSDLKATIIDARQIPDLVPILAVVASYAEGKTQIINAQRLRIKESDRLKAISEGLKKIGADVEETEDGLIIKGKKKLQGGSVLGYNDHRIVMSMSVAALGCEEEVRITDKESIKKSYPDYFNDMIKIGGKVE